MTERRRSYHDTYPIVCHRETKFSKMLLTELNLKVFMSFFYSLGRVQRALGSASMRCRD
jgi:hypothetical protein